MEDVITNKKPLKCPICYNNEIVTSIISINGITVTCCSCSNNKCIGGGGVPVPFIFWQNIPRFPEHVAPEVCLHCERMVPGKGSLITPWDRHNVLDLLESIKKGQKVSNDVWTLIRRCISNGDGGNAGFKK